MLFDKSVDFGEAAIALITANKIEIEIAKKKEK